MYWNNNVLSSHLESLLSNKDITLQELMDKEEILQECKAKNKQLIEYLIRSDVLEQLVTLTTVEPTGDDYSKYKYANIACELLTCEVLQLSEKLADNNALLGKLYSFLESDAPLNPLLASFFSKTFSGLVGRKSEQNWYSYQFTCLNVLQFLKSKENSVSLLLKHLGTSAIMDLLFKLIAEVEGLEVKQNMLNWLDDQKLVQKVVALFDPSVDPEVCNNAAQLLCDVIRTARDYKKETYEPEPDRILDSIESPETVSLLLENIFKEEKCETSIIGGISVLLALLEGRSEDKEQHHFKIPVAGEENVSDIIKAILPRLKDFHDLLLHPPAKPAVSTTIGVLDPPLGNTRVEVAKLLSVLVAYNNFEVNQKLAELDTVNVLLDLFFKYTWNNFLHTQVEHFLAFAFVNNSPTNEGDEKEKNFLVVHVLEKCRLLQRILDAWEDNETQQKVYKRPRRGYMGHLIKIANTIVQQANNGPFCALLTESVDYETYCRWKNFVDTKLLEVNEICQTCLGGVYPQDMGQESKLQEMYSSYNQYQSSVIPDFGDTGSLQEEQYVDNEEIMNSSSDLFLQKVSFNINEDDLDQQAASFEEVCNQNYPTLDDDDLDLLQKKIEAKSIDNLKSDWPDNLENNSSDEDDPPERSGPDGREDIHSQFDSLSSWPGTGEKMVPPLTSINPWDTTTLSNLNSSTSPDIGWANFESASFVTDFSLNLTPEIKTTIATSGPSSDIETIPLDLTPSDSNVNVDEMFMESLQIVENVPITGVYTNIDSITNAFNNLNTGSNEKVAAGNESIAENEIPKDGNELNSQSLDDAGDVHCMQKSDNPEANDNVRLLSSQGLQTKCGQQSEFQSESGGDGFKLLQENVQTVPNESNQTSNNTPEIVESCSPPVATTNGPV